MKEPINVKKQDLGINIKRLACNIKNRYLDNIYLFPVLKDEDIVLLNFFPSPLPQLPPNFCSFDYFNIIQVYNVRI